MREFRIAKGKCPAGVESRERKKKRFPPRKPVKYRVMRFSSDRFRDLVAEALDDLPERFRQMMDNVEIVVEELPPPEIQRRFSGILLGLYQGVPLHRRSVMGFHFPDKISIYKRNIERICRTPDEVRSQVRTTLMHEIGHHFGLDERELRDAGV